jgi:1-acyl-sn-glycerol-3-phosphate acyltransferase
MDSQELRSRGPKKPPQNDPTARNQKTPTESHPGGKSRYGPFMEIVRLSLFVTWFMACTFTIHTTQLLGAPLYLVNRDYYYAYMALTKQQYGVFITTITQWFSPTPIRVSGDSSVKGQLKQAADGRLETDFPERLVLIANHQLYTDWLYLWWVAYTSRMHGHIFIVLKEVFKYVPIIGPAMMFYGFIFMSRKWATDQSRIAYRLKKLTTSHSGPMSGSQELDPMWLLIFPEGTNLSANTRKNSAKWAEKQGIKDMTHQVLPRSTGLQFVLSELKGTIDYVYDCTVGYEGIPWVFSCGSAIF